MNHQKRSSLTSVITSLSLALALCSGILIKDIATAQGNKSKTIARQTQNSALTRYTLDLTAMARQGKLSSASQHDAEIRKAIEILAHNQRNNPVLVSDSDFQGAEVAACLAQQIIDGDIPEQLRNTRLYSLNIDALVEGVKTTAELEQRIKAVLTETENEKNLILFVDELHQFVGTRATETISRMLSGAVAGGKLRLIGSTSQSAFEQYIASDNTLDGLFQQVRLDEGATSAETTNAKQSRKRADDFEGDKISEDLRNEMQSAASGSDRVSVILQTDDAGSGRLNSMLNRLGLQVSSRMTQLGAIKVEGSVAAIEKLAAQSEIRHLSLDKKVMSLGHISATTGADDVRQQTATSPQGVTTSYGLDGSGIGIAVLDSGIDINHVSFLNAKNNSRVVFSKDFTGENRTDDPYGHGTHVASTAAGNGRVSNGKYIGIAPNANIINLRVLDGTGSGSVSGLLGALDWLVTNRTAYNIRVVNMSVGILAVDSYRNDPVCRAVRRLVDAGVVVAAAAGNNGKDGSGQKIYGEIHSPGIEPSAITVGGSNTFGTNVRDDDAVATFSSRGPTRGSWKDALGIKHFDNLVKPDLVAPGNKMVYAEAANNLLVTQHPELEASVTSNNRRKEMILNGTSMATPIVAGAAALLLQVNAKLTPNMIKMILMYTAQQLKGSNMLEQGTGEINIEGAVRLAKAVRTDLPTNADLGAPFLSSTLVPTARTTIAGGSFGWSQGILLKRSYATGINLITKYQKIYSTGVLMGDGVLIGDGVLLSDGVLIGDNILTSNGVLLADGTVFCSAGVLMGDGVLLSDGVILGDGVLIGDGVLLSDGVLLADASFQAQSALIFGDPTKAINLEVDTGVDYLGY